MLMKQECKQRLSKETLFNVYPGPRQTRNEPRTYQMRSRAR